MAPTLSTFGAASARTYGFAVGAGAPSAWVFEYGSSGSSERNSYHSDRTCLWVNNTYGGVLTCHQDGEVTYRPAVANILDADGNLQLSKVLTAQNFANSANTMQDMAGCALGNDGKFWFHGQFKHAAGTYGLMNVVAHFNSSGTTQWARQVGFPSSGTDIPASIAYDPDTDVVHTSHRAVGITGQQGVMTRFNSNGTTPFEGLYPSTNNYDVQFNDVMYNSVDGFYYYCGFSAESGSNRGTLGKFTSGSSSHSIPSNSNYQMQDAGGATFRFHQLAHDSSGNVFAVGTLFTTQKRTVVVKFNSNLSGITKAIYITDASNANNCLASTVCITVDSDDNVIIAGEHNGENATDRVGSLTTNNKDLIIISLKNDLTAFNWHSVFGSERYDTGFGNGNGYGANMGQKLMADDNGSFYICGNKQEFYSGSSRFRFFVAKLPADGSLIDSVQVGPSADEYKWISATANRQITNYGIGSGWYASTTATLNTNTLNYTQDSTITNNFAPVNETSTTKTTYTI